MRYTRESNWLKAAVISVKEPLQFLAVAYGSPVVVLIAAMWNGKIASMLDKDGLLVLSGMMAFVQLSVLAVFAVVVRRPSDPPRIPAERAGKYPAKVP